jgi:hypothetical protein
MKDCRTHTIASWTLQLLVLRRGEIPVLGSFFIPLHELSCEAKRCQH